MYPDSVLLSRSPAKHAGFGHSIGATPRYLEPRSFDDLSVTIFQQLSRACQTKGPVAGETNTHCAIPKRGEIISVRMTFLN